MEVKEIRGIFERLYNRIVWKSFIQKQVTNNKLTKDDTSLNIAKTDIHKYCHSVGFYEVNENTKIDIFKLQLNDSVKLTRKHVGLRNLIKAYHDR